MDRKDWNRIGLAAAVLLVPGGFILGATLAARRAGKAMTAMPEPTASDGVDDPSSAIAPAAPASAIVAPNP
ncbi:hypothetical protein [Sphingomonas sp. 28-63-12]|uniref:hypothetical protein n=1 Tax=Sphingomonas sp. 28-63-12 TaxID=1970434 RepID=UPI0035A97460